MEPIIKILNLRKSFDGNAILDDISLEIRPGESLSIVGGSGSGKTVLTKHFNGLLRPDSGEVIVYGKNLADCTDRELDDIRRRIGYVFQGNALFASDMSEDIYANVSLPLRADPYDYPSKNEHEIEARARTALEDVGLGDEFFDRMPNELSGGQKKRVAVARAVIGNPPVVIYDEPTTGLDPESTEMIIDLIDKLYRQNHNTSIAITHEKKLMMRLARVVFLLNGKVYFDGSQGKFFGSSDEAILRFLAVGDERTAGPEVVTRLA